MSSTENQIHEDAVAEEEEERKPLLDSSIVIVHENGDNTILPSSSSPNQRLVSLDVFRGLTVARLLLCLASQSEAPKLNMEKVTSNILLVQTEFGSLELTTTQTYTNSNWKLVAPHCIKSSQILVQLMILVDDVGRAFPSLNHSPWFGVTLADFVMPFFLFGVGVSIGLVFKKVSSKPNATKKVILRTIKLFLLGLLLQGGYFHGRGNLTYGLDLSKIRWFGVLQRISIGYFLASMSEIWLVNNNILVDSPAAFVRKYSIQWIFSILLCSVYLCLLYGLYVPNWKFEHSNLLWSGRVSTIQNVHCEMRGSLDPPCNAVGFIDRLILGEDHMYQRPVYRRTKECSVNSPDYGPLPPDSPGWCLAPFDPEGILSSLMAAITCFVGLQFGHILVIFQVHKQRVLLWSVFSFSLLVVGYILEILGIPLSKALYTLSFMFITAGVSGLVLTAIYYIVDIERLRKPTVLLQWMGMNALIVYALAACDIFPAIIQGFYWRSPENNLVDASEALIQNVLHSEKWGTLAFVIIEILFWGLLAGFLHKKGIYIKL